MRVTVGVSRAVGEVKAPPSKSMAHRLLLCAALSDGESVVGGVSFSQDILATLDCMKALGAEIAVDGDVVRVRGARLMRSPSARRFPCRESGSTLRFMIPIAMASGGESVFAGSERLLQRPLEVYEKIAKEQGIAFEKGERELSVRGQLRPGDFTVEGNVSSQFISGLLFALPHLDGDSTLTVLPPLESRPYIDMTLQALSAFGYAVRREGDVFHIPGGQRGKAVETTVEGDWSNAAFLLALGLLSSGLSVRGLNENSLQGDKVCVDIFKKLQNGFCTVDLSDCPDLGPIAFAVASLFDGGEFTGTRRLRAKESDRVAAMAEELSKCGAKIEIYEDRVIVRKAELHAPTEEICGHNDHRIVMAMTALLSTLGGTIEGAEAVTKSYPDFFEKIKEIGIEVKKDGLDL